MAILPTRTSADVNASADINELSSEALDKGGSGEIAALPAETTPVSGDLFMIELAAGGLRKIDVDNMPGVGDSTEKNPEFGPGQLIVPTANPATLEAINTGSITNVRLMGYAYDDGATDEIREGEFQIPSDISTTGTDVVTFKVVGIAQTAATANVVFRFSHSATGDGADADLAYTDEDSGAKAVDTTQDYNTVFTWTETITNLTSAGWAANKTVNFQLLRMSSSESDTLSDDFYVRRFLIDIPRTT